MSEMINTIFQNEFGAVSLEPLYAGGKPVPRITLTTLPGDVAAAIKAKGVRVTLPLRVYLNRATQRDGKWVDFRSLKIEGGLQIAVDSRPGLAALWEAADSYERQRDAEAKADRDRATDAFSAGVPECHILVRLTGSVPDPAEAGMSVLVYSDDSGREYHGLPERRSADGALGYVPAALMATAAVRAAEKRAKDAAEADRRIERVTARRAELLAVDVPANAVAAYKRCKGDPERLPDDIDNPLYWIVKQYADAIEEQGLAYASPARAATRQEVADLD